METLFPLMIIVFFSNIVEACAGFGATLLAIIFGAQFFMIEDLIPILVPLNLILSLIIVLRYSKDIDLKLLLKRILPLTAIGMPIGIFIFQNAPSNILKIGFGAIVVTLGLFELAKAALEKKNAGASRPLHEWQAALFLIGGGIMQGLYASGGPFVVYYASRAIPDKGKFRTTLALLWLILNILLTASLAISGKMNTYTIQFSSYLLPFVLVGTVVGMKVHDFVSETTFRRLVYALLVIAGASLIYRSL